ncbi:MAG: hypothetical protein PWQ55_569 [Chloroflexota bacterium]|nr:hypothetical protein [Chloroflexota bacterium]
MFKKLFRVFLLVLVGIGVGCESMPVIETVDSYMITYIEDVTGRLRVRYAGEDATAEWLEGGTIEGENFPSVQYLGTGLGSHSQGTMAVLGTLTGNKIDLRLGIGPFFSRDPDDTISTTALSAPSITHIDGAEYMIAYQYFDPLGNLLNGRLGIVSWDSSPGIVISETAGNMPPLSGGSPYPYSDYLDGQPAIAYMKEKELLLVMWNREGITLENPGTIQYTTQYALGTYPYTSGQNTIVNWTRYGKLGVLEPNGRYAGSPSLATDGENFYFAMPIATKSPYDGEYTYTMAVFKSPDGLHWTLVRSFPYLYSFAYSGIAVQPNGDMLVGKITYAGEKEFRLLKDGSWIDLDPDKVLGGNPELVGGGKHVFSIETFKLQIN